MTYLWLLLSENDMCSGMAETGEQVRPLPPPTLHCTEIDFALSFGAVIVKIIDLSKTATFDIILDQKYPQKLHFLLR